MRLCRCAAAAASTAGADKASSLHHLRLLAQRHLSTYLPATARAEGLPIASTLVQGGSGAATQGIQSRPAVPMRS